MTIKKELLAPCGLYCGVCGIRIAYLDDNQKFKERLCTVYGTETEDIRCEGCLAAEEQVFIYCRTCPIKSCTQEKNLEGCHQCDDFPCEHIDNFPLAVGKKVILRAVPQRREWGDEKWVQEEEKRYVCPHCGYKIFRGAKRCRQCKEPLDLD